MAFMGDLESLKREQFMELLFKTIDGYWSQFKAPLSLQALSRLRNHQSNRIMHQPLPDVLNGHPKLAHFYNKNCATYYVPKYVWDDLTEMRKQVMREVSGTSVRRRGAYDSPTDQSVDDQAKQLY